MMAGSEKKLGTEGALGENKNSHDGNKDTRKSRRRDQRQGFFPFPFRCRCHQNWGHEIVYKQDVVDDCTVGALSWAKSRDEGDRKSSVRLFMNANPKLGIGELDTVKVR